MSGRITVRAKFFSLGFLALACGLAWGVVFACGRTSLHRCDLAGCLPPTICADAGGSLEDAGSDAFCCVLPDSGTPCTALGDSCLDRCAGPCCSGTTCNSNGFCAANAVVDAGSCLPTNASCSKGPQCCSLSCVGVSGNTGGHCQ